MNTRTLLATAVASAGLFVVPTAFAQEVTVPNEFTSGDAAVASEVNENFQTIAEAINNISSNSERAVSDAYGQDPSPAGQPRAGLVYREEAFTFDTETNSFEPTGCYEARLYYENSDGVTLQGPSGDSITPDFIFDQVKACEGQAEFEYRYRYGIPAADANGGVDDFRNADGLLIENRFPEFDDQLVDYRNEVSVASAGDVDIVHGLEWYVGQDGTPVVDDFSRIRSLSDDSVSFNGLTFDDIAVETISSKNETRIRARDVGVIYSLNIPRSNFSDPVFPTDGSTRTTLVFSRDAEGNERGSLDGVDQKIADLF